jgi:hypothetical protein
MGIRKILRKLVAGTALLALLAASTPALADSLSLANPAACCNTVYCPLHHNQARSVKREQSNCDLAGNPAEKSSSMRACDDSPHQVTGTSPFTLAAPVAIFQEPAVQPAPIFMAAFFPSVCSNPTTPPPRALLS